jgi:aminopeptidase N
LDINYKWNDTTKTETVYLKQNQDGQTFKLPFAVDIYAAGKKDRYKVWMNDKADTLTFKVASKPDLVNVDGDKVLLCAKTDNKSLEAFEFQYFNAPLYLDRFEAINAVAGKQSDKGAQKVLIAALRDKYYGLRIKAINALHMTNDDVHNAALPVLTSLAQTDDNTLVRAAAISTLGKLKMAGNMDIFKQALTSQSYAIQGAALNGINQLDPKQALSLAKGFEKDNEGALTTAIVTIYSTGGGDAEWSFAFNAFDKATPQGRFNMIRGGFAAMIGNVPNPAYAQQGIAALRDMAVKYKQFGIAPTIIGLLNQIKTGRTKLNDDASAKAVDDAIKAINDAK